MSKRKKSKRRRTPSKFNSEKLALLPLSAAFIVLGLFFWWFFWASIINSHSSGDWVEAPCTVEVSEVRRGKSTYNINFEFIYEVHSRQRRSDMYDFTNGNRPKSRCESIVRSNPVGSHRRCFYDPKAPDNAVIVRDYDFSLAALLFPLVFVAVGVWGFLPEKTTARVRGFFCRLGSRVWLMLKRDASEDKSSK